MQKKLLSWLLVLALLFSLCSAAGTFALADTYDVLIWASSSVLELTRSQVEEFNKTNADGITINANIVEMSESDSASRVISDPETGADLYCFVQDQQKILVNAGALSRLDAGAASAVAAENDASSVAAASCNDTVYAYPLSSDNGYFMFYDKSVIPEADVDSLEKLIADCEAANKYFAFEIGSSSWYMASFFFATGCTSEWRTDAEGNFADVYDTFNSNAGLTAARGMKKLMDSSCFMDSSSVSEFGSDAAIVVSGTWGYDTAVEILGDHLGMADLPSFTVDGQKYHLGSYSGNKLLGLKPQADEGKAAALHKLAQYLSGKTAQLERYDAAGWAPSNRDARESEAVQSSPALAALLSQAEYAVPQNPVHGAWWTMALTIPEGVQAAADEAEIQSVLNRYSEDLTGLFDIDQNALLFVGQWNNWNNIEKDEKYYLKDGTVTLFIPQLDFMGGRIINPGHWGTDKGYSQVVIGKELLAGADEDNNMLFREPGVYTITWNGTGISVAALDCLILPADLVRVESKAFSGGNYDVVVMNDSVQYIAEDAFDSAVIVYAPADSYAWSRCKELSLAVREK